MPKQVNADFERVKEPVHKAFNEEVHMFTHIHLRGYDKEGDGKQMHADYYDKYGAPMKIEDSWLEGYRAVEKEIAEHFNSCLNPALPFPMPGAVAGGSHLYEMYHFDKPWNWTGFVPQQRKWCCFDRFYPNRHFIQVRGNEIQNNLWNYDPHEENESAFPYDSKYEQIVPDDEYRDGYFFFKNPWGRYLHVISLKSMTPEPEFCKRYNYIVHPLAYRSSLSSLPDNSVDAMQWSINQINSRALNKVPEGKSRSRTFPAFGDDQLHRWGEKNHGLEIFNDFTYYYSASPLDEGEDDKWLGGNGYLHDKPGTNSNNYIHWFDSYPHEMGEFLIETAFRHGTYLYIMAANDAMYQRNEVEVQFADPKASQTSKFKNDFQKQSLTMLSKTQHKKANKLKNCPNEKASKTVLGKMPYQENTVFGYITLVDPAKKLKSIIYGEPPYNNIPKLDEGENLILDHMIDGRFYSHTGVYDIFNYKDRYNKIVQHFPIFIENQSPKEYVTTFNPENHDLAFTLPKAKKPSDGDNRSIQKDIIWQVTVELHKPDHRIECLRGYFKLSEIHRTKIDFREFFEEEEVAWVRIQGYDVNNPQRRAWFQAIKGPMFGKSKWVGKNKNVFNPSLTNVVLDMENEEKLFDGEEFSVYKPNSYFQPESVSAEQLIFNLGKTSNEDMLCVYNLQVHAHKQHALEAACSKLPPTYLQNVCGVFLLSEKFPIKLDLNRNWDKATVKDNVCQFYLVDLTGKPLPLENILKTK